MIILNTNMWIVEGNVNLLFDIKVYKCTQYFQNSGNKLYLRNERSQKELLHILQQLTRKLHLNCFHLQEMFTMTIIC